MADKKLFLLDAYALIYRSYYALIRNPMFNTSGFNTSTIFGFTNTLEEVLNKEKPTHIAVAFDPPTPTFRHELYPKYKAQREETPEEIVKSVPRIRELIEAYRIPIIECPGYEADDVIGTIAKHAASIGFDVYMMTPDKDYAQLVDEHIYMYKPARSGKGAEILDTAKVREVYKVKEPIQFIEVLAIMGDKSDNIPGVKGIGEVGATKLIDEFGTVENLLENIDHIKGANKDKIIEHKDDLLLSKTLVTISTDVPITFSEENYAIKTPDISRLKELFKEFNFRTFLSRLEDKISPKTSSQPQQLSLFDSATPTAGTADTPPEERIYQNIDTVEHEYHIADNQEKRQLLIRILHTRQEFCFDTETTGLETFNNKLVGISFSVKPHSAWYVPVPQDESSEIIAEFRELFENPEIRKIGQNLKFDMLVLKQYGVDTKGALFDTMLAHYLIQPEQRHNLNYLSEKYLDYSPVEIETLIGKSGKNQMNMIDVPLEKIASYAAEDADIALQLKEKLEIQLRQSGMEELAQTVEMPLARVLACMEATGVKIDVSAMDELAQILNADAEKLEEEIYQLADTRFNIASPKQLGDVLFVKLNINDGDRTKKTKTKQFSTSEEVLSSLTGKHPIVSKILEYRGLKKLLSTYVEALPKLINPHTGKIHTSFNQAVTSTGRLSSTDPNLQNIPIREERGREIRKAFIPSDEDHLLLSADYSQIELRLMAHMSNDPNMLDAFRNNEDIHAATAAKIYGIPVAEVNSDMRRKAKTANFGIIYGISVFGLSQRLNIPRTEAQDLISGYFDAYKEVRNYMNNAINKAKEQGYVETLMGRRRYIPDIRSANAVVR
jgi:DNA polymerase-1